MRSFYKILLLTMLVSQGSSSVFGGLFWKCHKDNSCAQCCVECECKTVDVDCFEVECKQVCVPPVCLPDCLSFCGRSSCGSGCTTGAACGSENVCGEGHGPSLGGRMMQCLFGKFAKGRVRCVSKLKESSYETRKPSYKWTVRGGGCGAGCGNGCATGCGTGCGACCPPADGCQ